MVKAGQRKLVISVLIILFIIISLSLIISFSLVIIRNFEDSKHAHLITEQDKVSNKISLPNFNLNGNYVKEIEDDFESFENLYLSSSGGGGSSGSKKTSKKDDNFDAINNETDLIDNSSDFVDNETCLNNSINETNNESNLNESDINETENETNLISENFSTSKSFEAIEVKSIIDSSIIKFNPPLPPSICGGEVIDVKLDLGTVNLRWSIWDPADYISCMYNGQKDISVKYCLMEEDWLNADDEVKCVYATATTYDCSTLNLENFRGTIVKREFTNVKLSDWIIPDPGGNGEFYAKVSNYNNYFYAVTTPSYNVYGYVSGECKCLSGSCCDLSSRPYKFKPYPSQPTGYTDYYYCSGTESATSTSYVIKKDYYCSGSSSVHYSRSLLQDTCGTCEYCTPGDSSCNYYGKVKCGTYDCSSLDTACRKYDDLDKYCSVGVCKVMDSCYDFYTNEPKGTSCGTNNECDGYGSCIYCDGYEYTQCYDNDVYYYDYCDNRKEKKLPDCGNDYEGTTWYPYCDGNEVWKKKSCLDRGCNSGSCYENWYDCYNTYVETCDYECQAGVCKPDPNIECSTDSDCPTIWSNPYCQISGDSSYVKKYYTTYECVNSNCEEDYSGYYLVENCGEVEYSENYCDGDNVYRNFTDKCSSGVCSEQPPVKQLVEECGTGGCSGGSCTGCSCSEWTNDACGTGSCSSSQMHQIRSCTPSGCDQETQCVDDASCSICDSGSYPSCTTAYAMSDGETKINMCGDMQYYKITTTQTCDIKWLLNDDSTSDYDIYTKASNDSCPNTSNYDCRPYSGANTETCTHTAIPVGTYYAMVKKYSGSGIYSIKTELSNCGCTSHAGYYCYNDDIYWYDSCGGREEKKEECPNGCTEGRCLVKVCKTVCNFGKCYEYCDWQ